MRLIPIVQDNKTIYKCSCCNTVYENMPLCFGAEVPSFYNSIPAAERKKRVELEKSLCVIDQKHFFHRGSLIIPIIDNEDDLIFDVWTSISQDNFCKRMDLWNDPDRIKEEPYFGWLNTHILTYGNTLNIKCIAIEQELGCIPDIVVTEENHPLTIDQQNGITMDKALDIVSEILHFKQR